MVAFADQFGVWNHARGDNFLAPALMIMFSAVVGGVLILILERVIPRVRRAIKARVHQRRRLHAAATSELRSRMQMDELCPYGWQAHITVYSSAADLPPEAVDPERTRVALDWAALSIDSSPETVVVRRIWAETVNRALEAMVADRMTDETLQDIELRALADGAEWPEE